METTHRHRTDDRTSVEPSSSASDQLFATGDIVAGRYRMVTRIGRGGMGEVWRADDLMLGQPVALKVARVPRCPTRSTGRRESCRLRTPHLARRTPSGATCTPLGSVLFELVTGQRHCGLSESATEPPRLSALAPDISPALEQAILTAIALSPDDRPATVRALAAALPRTEPARYVGSPVSAVRRSRRAAWWVAASLKRTRWTSPEPADTAILRCLPALTEHRLGALEESAGRKNRHERTRHPRCQK